MSDRTVAGTEIEGGNVSAENEGGEEFRKVLDSLHCLQAGYKRFSDATHEARFVVDPTGRLIDINQAGVELFGFSGREEMLRADFCSSFFVSPEEKHILQHQLEEEGFVRDYQIEVKKKDDTPFYISVSAQLWFDESGALYYEGYFQDLTQRRDLEATLSETQERIMGLGRSEENLRMLNRHILQMLMIMSHDIRSPLVAVAATLKLLMRGMYGNMDESVANTIKDLLSRVGQVLGIAEDCLGKAYSVDGSFRMDREVLDLRQDVIDPVLDELSNDIEKRGIRIDNRLGAIPAGSIHIKVNRMWLKTVFRNLFKNAVKYGGQNCRIAFGFEDHGGHYRLNVYNSGPPVPEEYRSKLFTRFGRIEGDGPNRHEGVGLGLFLIREIIRKHGGDIWYEAKPDGSDFIFTISKEEESE